MNVTQSNAGWPIRPLEEVVDVLDSKRVPVNADERKSREGNVPYYGATGQVGWIDNYLFDEELVLLGEDGAPFLEPSRPKAYVVSGKSWVNNHAHVLRARPERMTTRFLLHQLNSVAYAPYVSGTTRLKLPQGPMKRIPLVAPDIGTQVAIADEIDKQFSRIEAGVAALERIQANLKRYRASILKAACEGRLVPTEAELARKESRDYEPATVLLQRILKERRKRWEEAELAKLIAKGKPPKDDRWKSKYEEPKPPDTTNLPEIPEGWCWATVEQLLLDRMCNGLSVKGSNSPPGVAALKLSAMSDDGFDYSEIRYLPVDWADVEDLSVRAGDFYVSRGNGTLSLVGRGTLAQPTPQPTIIPDTIIRLRLVPEVTQWTACVWASRVIRQQIESRAKTTAGIYKISQEDLRSVCIPFPSFGEQHLIIDEVRRCLSLASTTLEAVHRNLQRARTLRSSVLHAAFSGQLCEKGADDLLSAAE